MSALDRFDEQSSAYFRAQVVDADGDPVNSADLTAGTLTLYSLDVYNDGVSPVQGIVNSRNNQDILGSGSPLGDHHVTYESDGYFRWDIQAADNAMPDGLTDEQTAYLTRRQIWRHKARFHFEWTNGQFNKEYEFEVTNLRTVTG